MIQNSSTTELDCNLEAPRQARQLVADALGVCGVPGRFPAAELVVSELVSNSVLHARCAQVRLDIDLHQDGRLRLAVVDPDPTRLPVRSRSPGEAGGHGLRIVDALANDWGVEVNGTSKVVWVELSGV